MGVLGEGSGTVKLGQRKVVDVATARRRPQYGKTVNVSSGKKGK